MSTLRVTNIQDLAGNSVFVLSGGNATIAGDLTVQGTTTSIETTNLTVEDKNIVLGLTDPAATDATADGGGITLKGTTDKTIAWVDGTDAWTSSERFSIPLGAEGVPSLTFTGDPNTGIYSPGADQVAIATGGAGQLFVDADGNVGINESSPQRKLHIRGVGSESDDNLLRFEINTAVSADMVLGGLEFEHQDATSPGVKGYYKCFSEDGGTDVYHAWGVSGGATVSEALRITSDGKLGLGTSSPDQTLHVRGAGAAIRVDDSDAGANVYGDILSEPGSLVLRSRGGASTHGSIDLRTWDGTTDASRLFIDNDGNVGIGTDNPSTPLDINQVPNTFTLNTNTIDYTIFLRGGGTSATEGDYGASIGFSRNNGGERTGAVIATKQTSSDADQQGIAFLTHLSSNTDSNLVEAMIIKHDGNVGIGTTDPSALLHLYSGANTTLRLSDSAGGYTDAIYNESGSLSQFIIDADPANTSTPLTEILFKIDGSEKVRIKNTGDVGIGTDAPGSRLAVNGSITESTDGGTTYHNVVTAQDIGTDPNQVSLNQFLGQLAFMDSVGDVPTASSAPQDNLSVNFEYVSNTSLKIRMRGTDGVVRSVTLTLS